MHIADILSKDAIQVNMEASHKEEVIQKLVDILAQAHSVTDKDVVLQAVLEREKLMSTGVGKGVAIPHGKCDGLQDLIASFALLKQGVDFGAPDGISVRLVLLMVASAKDTGPHIRALAHISRILQAESVRDKLVQANSSSEIMDILEEREEELGS